MPSSISIETAIEFSDFLKIDWQPFTASTAMSAEAAIGYSNLIIALGAILITIIFGFFAIAGITVLGHYRKHKKQLAKINYEIESCKALKNATYYNTIAAADIALTQLPEITYTQQIPSQLHDIIQILEKTFTIGNSKELWKQIISLEDGARIQLARGLYYMAKHGRSKEKMEHTIPPGDETIIELLIKAKHKCQYNSNPSLEKVICLRLAQAYRQVKSYNDAINTLTPLAAKKNSSAILGLAIIELQQGLSSKERKQRIEYFCCAKDRLIPVFEGIFGWSNNQPTQIDLSIAKERDSSIAYYTAKSMWAWYFAHEKSDSQSINNQTFLNQFRCAIVTALSAFYRIHKGEIHDLYINAIYHLCVAYILTTIHVCKVIDNKIVELLNTPHLTVAKDKQYIHKCLDISENNINELADSQSNGSQTLSIYVEGTERLDSFSAFRGDITLLRTAMSDPDAMFRFYGGSES